MIAKEALRRMVRRTGFDVVRFRGDVAHWQVRALRDRDVRTVVDVGANEGQYALRLRALGYAGRIVSVEPQSSAYRRLAQRASSDASWTAHHCAVGAKPGTATLHVAANSVSSSLLTVAPNHIDAEPAAAATTSEVVDVRTIDDVASSAPGPLWLKLDVQGAEWEALQGAEATVARAAVIQIECSLVPLYAGERSWLEVLAMLGHAGFQARMLEPGFTDPRTGDLLQADVLLTRD